MFLTAATVDIPAGQGILYAFLGYAMVFFGLILLMLVVILVGRSFAEKVKKTAVEVAAPETPEPKTAPGTAGQLKLHNVDPKTAAMLMAIVANKLGKPINELRFLSIKEVSQ